MFKLLIILIIYTLISTVCLGKTIYLLDFDNTIFDDSKPDSSWKTPWVLKKVSMVNTSAQLNQTLRSAPNFIQITPAEFALYQSMWAKDTSTLGALAEVQLPKDSYLIRPKVIVPGYYFVDDNTFQFYKTGADGENYLVENYVQAKERSRQKRKLEFDFLGNAFPIFRKLLSNPSTVADLHIFTARDQSTDEFQRLFEALKDDGLIENTVGTNKRGLESRPTIHQLQGYDSILYGRRLSENKRSVIKSLVTLLTTSTSELSDDFAIEEVKKFEIVKTHTLVVAEDDPTNIIAIGNLMKELSYGHSTRHIKLVLFNTSPVEVYRNLTPPYNQPWIVFDNGFVRTPHEREIQNYLGLKTLKDSGSSLTKDCRPYLMNKTRGGF